MKVAIITTDNREYARDYSNPNPHFGTAPEALLHGLEQNREIEVHVVSCARRTLQAPKKIGANIFFHSLCVPKLGWMRTLYQGCVRAVRHRLRQIQPDIVHGQGTEMDCALDAVFSGFPNVLTLHGNMIDVARVMKSRPFTFHWLASRLETAALGRTAGVFCNSRLTRDLVQPRARRTWMVPNAMRPDMFLNPPQPRSGGLCELLHVGAICPNKGQLEMLRVLRELHSQGLKFRLSFLGVASPGIEYTDTFLAEVREAERIGFARHLGFRPLKELIPTYDSAHALIHTPDSEAFGLVATEALARNLKVFAFGVGGLKDILEGTRDSVMVGSGDWDGLQKVLAEWITRGAPPAAANADIMGARYRPETIAARHLEIYTEVLNGKKV